MRNLLKNIAENAERLFAAVAFAEEGEVAAARELLGGAPGGCAPGYRYDTAAQACVAEKKAA